MNKQKNKGITLIALVVTIIVLLILAGISIMMLTGQNGILNRAGQAKEATEDARIDEMVKMSVMEALTNGNGKITEALLREALNKNLGSGKYTLTGNETDGWTIVANGKTYKVDANGTITSNTNGGSTGGNTGDVPAADTPVTNPASYGENPNAQATADGAGKYFPKPAGGKYVEGTVDTGVVIDINGSEFVWVPVDDVVLDKNRDSELPRPSDFEGEVGNQNGSSSNGSESGKGESGSSSNGSESGKGESGSSSNGSGSSSNNSNSIYYETGSGTITKKQDHSKLYTPMAVKMDDGNYKGILYYYYKDYVWLKYPEEENYQGIYNEPDILGGDYSESEYDCSNENLTKKTLQDEFNTMVKQVDKYKGFYVSRYQTGIQSESGLSGHESESGSENSKVVFKNASIESNNTRTAYLSWYTTYSKIKEFSTNSVSGYLIWGCQYDAMMTWMLKNGNLVTDEGNDKKNNTLVTGSSKTDVINNVFDLYGCNDEFTMEAYGSWYRVTRGGGGNGLFPAHRFQGLDTRYDRAKNVSRAILYIK